MTNPRTAPRSIDSTTTATATIAPEAPVRRDAGTRLLKKLAVNRPAPTDRDRRAIRP